MAVVPALQLPPTKLREPRQSLAFQCKCGCELFRADVEIYLDYSWATILLCAACGQICEPSEPLTNEPH